MTNLYHKLLSTIILGIISINASVSQDTEASAKTFNLKLGPTNMFANTILIGVEKFIQPNRSLQFFGSFTLNQPDDGAYDQIMGFSGEFQYRIYLITKKSMNGFYFAPYFKFENFEMKNLQSTSYNYDYMTTYTIDRNIPEAFYRYANIGLLLGYQFHISNTVIIDMYAGGGIKASNKNFNRQDYYDDFASFVRYNQLFDTGVAPKLGFRVGFSF